MKITGTFEVFTRKLDGICEGCRFFDRGDVLIFGPQIIFYQQNAVIKPFADIKDRSPFMTCVCSALGAKLGGYFVTLKQCIFSRRSCLSGHRRFPFASFLTPTLLVSSPFSILLQCERPQLDRLGQEDAETVRGGSTGNGRERRAEVSSERRRRDQRARIERWLEEGQLALDALQVLAPSDLGRGRRGSASEQGTTRRIMNHPLSQARMERAPVLQMPSLHRESRTLPCKICCCPPLISSRWCCC